MSGSDAMRLQNLVIALGPSSMPSSMLMSNTWAPISTCCLATLRASWGKNAGESSMSKGWGRRGQQSNPLLSWEHPFWLILNSLAASRTLGLLSSYQSPQIILKYLSSHRIILLPRIHQGCFPALKNLNSSAWSSDPCDLALTSYFPSQVHLHFCVIAHVVPSAENTSPFPFILSSPISKKCP